MKVHEYQAKELLKSAGVAVPEGIVVTAPADAAKAYDALGGGLIVVKAQVHAGGRGKGVAIGPDDDRDLALEIASGHKPRPAGMAKGVQLVKSAAEAENAAASLLGKTLVTYQTGLQGSPISKVLVTVGHDIVRELYLGMAIDRGLQCPVLMASTEGGVEIETVAHKSPEKILRVPIDVGLGLADFQARKISKALGLDRRFGQEGRDVLQELRQALHRHGRLARRDQPADRHGRRRRARARLQAELRRQRPRSATPRSSRCSTRPRKTRPSSGPARSGLSYVSLDGDIACLVNGAGLAMSTMDLIKYHGGEPANFLDVGGGANKDQVLEGFRILLSESRVKAVLVNIFGGIMKCDTIATALLAAYDELDFRVPLVVRLEGTNVELGKKLIKESGRKIITADGLTDAAQKVVAAAKGAA